MKRNGMFIGGHGVSHKWMNKLDAREQELEVSRTRDFLGSIGMETTNWAMSYPYGAYDDSLIEVLRKNQCNLAFTTTDKRGILDPDRRFSITRIDTNEIS